MKWGIWMVNYYNKDIKIDRTDEMRTDEISKMIEEGGLGADQYYVIDKYQSNHKRLVENIDQFRQELVQMNNDDLVDILIINTQENTSSKYSQALMIIKHEIVKRMNN